MPLFVIPFPAFDPVLVHIGPFAIRWYALAYIAGILLGWAYARALIRNERYWAGPAPLTVVDYDDFVLWVTLGIILGGRIGYVLFYNLPFFAAHPLEIVQLWNGGMSFHGGFTGCVLAVVLFARARGISDSLARRSDLRGGADRAVPRPHRQFHQRRIVGPAGGCRFRSLGDGVSQRRAVAAASEPALRGGAGRPAAARGAGAADPPRRASSGPG